MYKLIAIAIYIYIYIYIFATQEQTIDLQQAEQRSSEGDKWGQH